MGEKATLRLQKSYPVKIPHLPSIKNPRPDTIIGSPHLKLLGGHYTELASVFTQQYH